VRSRNGGQVRGGRSRFHNVLCFCTWLCCCCWINHGTGVHGSFDFRLMPAVCQYEFCAESTLPLYSPSRLGCLACRFKSDPFGPSYAALWYRNTVITNMALAASHDRYELVSARERAGNEQNPARAPSTILQFAVCKSRVLTNAMWSWEAIARIRSPRFRIRTTQSMSHTCWTNKT
jgi:hypothetical protein